MGTSDILQYLLHNLGATIDIKSFGKVTRRPLHHQAANLIPGLREFLNLWHEIFPSRLETGIRLLTRYF